MPRSDERLAKTERLIREAICQGPDTMLEVSVWFGTPDTRWRVDPTMGGPTTWMDRLYISVPHDWLETVGGPGIVLVESHLILDATPTSSVNTPEGCEGCWTVLASRWKDGQRRRVGQRERGAYPRVLASRWKDGQRRPGQGPGPWPIPAFVVKYGGLLAVDYQSEKAMDRLVRMYERGLGLRGEGLQTFVPES